MLIPQPSVATTSQEIGRYDGTRLSSRQDTLAVEAPLEIRLRDRHGERPLVVTMQTPGANKALAFGYLIAEGLIQPVDHIPTTFCVVSNRRRAGPDNSLTIIFPPQLEMDWSAHQRSTYVSSSCGLCGKTSIESVEKRIPYSESPANWSVGPELILGLPAKLQSAQSLFGITGGVHAAGLFDQHGTLVEVMEDVGRHNACDKLIGRIYLSGGRFPLDRHIMQLSGRASFELVQKAAMAGVKVLSAVGAPSSLAVELAKETGICLVGFNNGKRFNVYSEKWRIKMLPQQLS